MAPVTELLRKVAIFKDLEDGELARISEVCREQSFQAGEYIFREGEAGNRLYLRDRRVIMALDFSTVR